MWRSKKLYSRPLEYEYATIFPCPHMIRRGGRFSHIHWTVECECAKPDDSVRPLSCRCRKTCSTRFSCRKANHACTYGCHYHSNSVERHNQSEELGTCLQFDDKDVRITEDGRSLQWYNAVTALTSSYESSELGPGQTRQSEVHGSEPQEESESMEIDQDSFVDSEREIVELDRFTCSKTKTYDFLLGGSWAAIFVRGQEDHRSATAQNLEIRDVQDILRQETTPIRKASTFLRSELLPGHATSFVRSLEALASAAAIYKLLPDATLVLLVVWKPLCSTKCVHKVQCFNESPFDPPRLSSAQAFAGVKFFETGTQDIDHSQLENVMAMCSSDSIYAAGPLPCDPIKRSHAFKPKMTVGNID